MTATLPAEVQQVFDTFITTEFTTVDAKGQPIAWPLTPYYRLGDPCIDVTTGLGYPKKANDARANPKVAVLFSDPTGSGLEGTPQVLVQGIADVDDRDLDANRARYKRELAEKLPGAADQMPPKAFDRLLTWYWRASTSTSVPSASTSGTDGDVGREPSCSTRTWRRSARGTPRSPRARTPPAEGGAAGLGRPHRRAGSRYPTAVVSLVAPDGFPFSVRLPVEVDRAARRVRLGGGPVGVPWQPGLACVVAHDHSAELQLAAQLPGARRPRRGGRRLGGGAAQAAGRLRAAAQRDRSAERG